MRKSWNGWHTTLENRSWDEQVINV